MKLVSGQWSVVSGQETRQRREVLGARCVSAARCLFAVCCVLILSALCVQIQAQPHTPSYGPMRNQGDQPQVGLPVALRDVGIDQKLNEQVPLDLKFRDESGQEVELGKYFGKKPVVLSLVYYNCPMLCTQVLNGMTSTFKILPFEIGNQFDVVTVSFDPRETPKLAEEKKESYLQRLGKPNAAAGWHFLTGDEASIKRLADAVGFRYTFDSATNQYAHASGIMVLTPQGKISHYFYGIEYSAKDLRLGLVEAADGKIGSRVDQLLLYCYHYDPTTGKYAWVINLYRWGGALTVLAMAGMLFLLRRPRRNEGELKAGGTA